MTHYPQCNSGRDCPPPIDPADQPYPPGDGCGCCPLPETTAPVLQPPAACPTDPCCHCPTTSTPQCLERLIEEQTTEITATTQATSLKDDLTKLLETTKAGHEKYTRDEYDSLIEQWVRLDIEIAELLRTLECKADCWRCVVECCVCPLLHELHYAEKRLYDDGHTYGQVYDLYDEHYWHTKDHLTKERRYERINKVLDAWADPLAKISAVMAENKALYETGIGLVGKEPGKVIFDAFFKLVPQHLAIAPPRGSEWQTRIDKRFTQFCECGHGTPDVCCGPDAGELTIRQRLTGPLPNLIDPGEYLKLICCLVERRWKPARIARDEAQLRKTTAEGRITTNLGKITGDWKAAFETAARAAIPSVFDCCDYDPDRASASKSSRYSAH